MHKAAVDEQTVELCIQIKNDLKGSKELYFRIKIAHSCPATLQTSQQQDGQTQAQHR